MEMDHLLEKMSFKKEKPKKKKKSEGCLLLLFSLFACLLACLWGIANAKVWQCELADYIQIDLNIRGKSSWWKWKN